MVGRIFLPNSFELVVSSFGGAGTTFLLRYVERYRRTNSPVDLDGLKHSAVPPLSFNRQCRFVYLFGSPQLAVLSFFRRNLHSQQSGKLLNRGRRIVAPIPKGMTLEDYAVQGIDRFLFRRHFFNWYRDYLATHPTMFVRYETLFDNVTPLLDFLELSRAERENFPKREERKSRLDEISATTLGHLNHMYGDFADELAKLPDIEVRQSSRPGSRVGKYLESPYLKAYVSHGVFLLKELMERRTPKAYALFRSVID